MRREQRGVTTIGWLVLLMPFAVVIYAGIRLAPIYLNYMNVARTLTQVSSEYQSGGRRRSRSATRSPSTS